jgi:hypothetical protein
MNAQSIMSLNMSKAICSRAVVNIGAVSARCRATCFEIEVREVIATFMETAGRRVVGTGMGIVPKTETSEAATAAQKLKMATGSGRWTGTTGAAVTTMPAVRA